MIDRQFIAFVVAGGMAAGVNFGSRIALSHWLSYVPAIVLAYCIGMFTAFMLNRLFVFKRTGNALHQQAFWFVMVNLFAVLQTVLISLLLARWLFPAVGMDFHPETIAHAVGVILPVFTSFVGHKRLSFRS